MCLLDTADGALMLSLYIQPATNFLPPKPEQRNSSSPSHADCHAVTAREQPAVVPADPTPTSTPRDPIAFLYYSIVLTTLTVIVAIVIGILQLLTLILNVAEPTGPFWDGVQTAGDYYDVIGGSICGCFIVFGLLSVVLYRPWRRWVGRKQRLGSNCGRKMDAAAADDDRGTIGPDAVVGADTADSSESHPAASSSMSVPVPGKDKHKEKSGSTEIAIRQTNNS